MKPLKNWFCTLLTAASLTATATQATTIRIGHDSQESSPLHQAFLLFEQEVESQSNGDIDVVIYPAAQLGGVQETTEAVQQGNLQMTVGASVLLAPYVPEFNVLDTFYLFQNTEHAHRVLDSDAGLKLLDAMASKGFHGLGFMEVGFRNISNNKRPINELSDLSGIKIRSAANPTQIAAWKAIGTSPIPLAWGEIFTSLQQGLIDGQESAVFSIYTQRFFEAQKYLSLSEHIYTNYVWFANGDFWQSLSAEQKRIINEAAAKTIAKQRELAAQQNSETIEVLKNEGMVVNSLSPEVRAQLKERLNGAVRDTLREKTGPALYDEVITAVETMAPGKGS